MNNNSSTTKYRWSPLIISILSILLGIICLLNPQIEMESIALYAGFIFLLYGVLQIVNGVLVKDNSTLRIMFFIFGIVVIVLAILDFANLELVGKYLPTLFGFFMVVCAVNILIPSLGLMTRGFKGWWFSAVPAVILLIFGLLFLLKPGTVGQTFGILTGIALLVNGVSNLISYIQLKK